MHNRRNRRKAVTVATLTAVLAAGTAAAAPASAGAAPAPDPSAGVVGQLLGDVLPLLGMAQAAPRAAARTKAAAPVSVTAPSTPSQCQAKLHVSCYDGRLLRAIYGVAGTPYQGQGATVALIMPYRNPVIRHDLNVYSRQAGLPAPDLHVTEFGHPVTASTRNSDQTLAEAEETLDLEMIHAMAPMARLDLVETEKDFSRAPSGFSYAAAILRKLPSILGHRVDAASFSLGSSEQNYAEEAGSTARGDAVIRRQATDIDAAVRGGTTVMAGTGDTGAASYNLAGTKVYRRPSVFFPAADSTVTAVSGAAVHADDSGTRTSPDTVWESDGATGGGLSRVWSRPSWQNPYASLTGNHRGIGDVAMDGASQTEVWTYTSRFFPFKDQAPGWVHIAGTSVSAPLFTGLVADAAALAGHSLGNINPPLYALARSGAAAGVQPITSGCNTYDGIRGYCAGPGPWSLPDGTGTVEDAALFVPALAAAASR